MTVLRSGSATDVGKVRSSNQDVALEEQDLFAVADGMGGHVGGEVAARVAIDTLRASFHRQPTVEGLRRAVAEANRAVWHQGQSESGLRGMGTTLTATALVRDPGGRQVIALANVGDSRAYVFSRGQVIQITADHSLAEERVRQGEMTEAEAAVHPHRHILTRALGVASDVDVDLWELHLTDGDRVLLCSDGLTNEVGEDVIGRTLSSTREPKDAARALVRAAVDHGGSDNVTVVVVDVVAADEAVGARASVAAAPAEGPVPGSGDPTTMTTASDRATVSADGAGAIAADGAPAGVASGDDATGVLRSVGAGAATAGAANGRAANGRAAHRASARSRAGRASAVAGSSGATTGVVTATRPTGPPGDAPDDGPGAARAARAPDASTSKTAAIRAAAGGSARSAAGAQAGAAAGAQTGTSARRPTDFGTQAAELRRLRPSRRELRRRRRMAGVPRMVTFRVVLFLVLLLAVVAAAYALVRWYATSDWYVAVDNQHLAVYQGRPGGFLWFKPKLVTETSVTTSEVLPFRLPTIEAKHQEPSLKAARRYVKNLNQEYLTRPTGKGNGTSATGGSTTSTTAASS